MQGAPETHLSDRSYIQGEISTVASEALRPAADRTGSRECEAVVRQFICLRRGRLVLFEASVANLQVFFAYR